MIALAVGAMCGLREATGLAPPPPLLSTEQVEWPSPDHGDDDETAVTFAAPESIDDAVEAVEAVEVPSRPGLIARTIAMLQRATGRRA